MRETLHCNSIGVLVKVREDKSKFILDLCAVARGILTKTCQQRGEKCDLPEKREGKKT